jgi:hypothetical protein
MHAHAKRKLTFRLMTLATLLLCLFLITPEPSRADDYCEERCMLNVLDVCDGWEGDSWRACIAYGQCQCHATCTNTVPDCSGGVVP